MSRPTVVAFATESYWPALTQLREDCEGHGLSCVPAFGSIGLSAHMASRPPGFTERRWACRWIPSFMLAALNMLDGPILYLHSDFRIQAPIPEAWGDLDVALQRRWFWRPDASGLPVLAAPIYAQNSSAARRFLGVWEALCLTVDDGDFEHRHLVRTWEIMQTDRSLKLGLLTPDIGSVAAEAPCPIVGHKR